MSKAIETVLKQIAEIDSKLEAVRQKFEDNTDSRMDTVYSGEIGKLIRTLEDLQKRLKFLKGE